MISLCMRMMFMMFRLMLVLSVVMMVGMWVCCVLLPVQLAQSLTGNSTASTKRQIRQANHSMSRAIHRMV